VRQGDRDIVGDNQSGRSASKLNNFTDKTWGEKACQLVKSTSRLDDTHWPMIKAHASEFYSNVEIDGEEGEGISENGDNPVANPHAFITLDWYVIEAVSIYGF
jgi:hypothetical protein